MVKTFSSFNGTEVQSTRSCTSRGEIWWTKAPTTMIETCRQMWRLKSETSNLATACDVRSHQAWDTGHRRLHHFLRSRTTSAIERIHFVSKTIQL